MYLPVLFLEVDLALAAEFLAWRGFFTSFIFVEIEASSTFSVEVWDLIDDLVGLLEEGEASLREELFDFLETSLLDNGREPLLISLLDDLFLQNFLFYLQYSSYYLQTDLFFS